MDKKTSEAQLKAVKKYKKKVNRITVDFTPPETDLWEHLQSQPKKQTYIKDLIRADMKSAQKIPKICILCQLKLYNPCDII